MAVFYGVALESTTIAQEEKVLLLKDVEEPKKTEEELKTAKTQLETRIKGLKENLTKAGADLRVGGLSDGNLRDNFMKHKNGSHRLSLARIACEFGTLFAVVGK